VSIKVGVTLPQFTEQPQRFLDGALAAEELGYDSVWVFDHLWPLSGGRDRPILESWTSLSHLSSLTERIAIGTLVTRSSLRHPVLLAKMVATVGEFAPGRLICALGSGDILSADENTAFGIPYFEGDDRLNQLASAMEVVTEYTSEEIVGHSDGFAHIDHLVTSPRPDLAPAIWIGGWSRRLLHLAGEGADGWNGWGTDVDRFARAARRVTQASGNRAVEISWAGQVMLSADDEAARRKLKGRDPASFLVGGPDSVAAQLERFVRAGANHLVVAFPHAGSDGSYELFADAVLPQVRERMPRG
jgi:alkanesulfonate monooxygenase SsuD/methylene tetrahydromethanopterin reductase-like flavin-dependent oxidoreductase (luciferase family)